MKILRLFSRIIVGLVFIFSGTVKAVDPLGSAFKFTDYFRAFNLDFLQPVALVLAIILCTAEFISGFSVLSGYRLKWGIYGVTILMLIFTPLTLILAISNPVSDCGCFGDAIHLTNWQTFGKNLILMAFSIILFTGRKNAKQITYNVKEWTVVSIITLLFICFSLLNLRYLPLFDFLPYKIGVNIPENMKIPEGKPADEYKTTFIYEKNGSRKEFTLENYPANDSTWKFIDQKSVLVKKGYTPPIHDFIITSPDGEDITGKILNDTGYTFLMISRKLEDAGRQNLEKGFEFGAKCNIEGRGFYIVTASGTGEIREFNNGFAFCTADETTLKTIVRSNPGFILLNGGTILGKWSWSNLPAKKLLLRNINEEQIRKINNKCSVLVVYSLAISAIVLLLIISSAFMRNKGGI